MATKAEQQTILRWDLEDERVQLYTANPVEARRWIRLGYAVDVTGRTAKGEPRGWSATGPAGCVRLSRLKDGQLPKRSATQLAAAAASLQKARAAQKLPKAGEVVEANLAGKG